MAGETILIVDDNPANLKVARIALESEGFDVRVAVDGEEALAILNELEPALILMDLQLPGIDGLSLTRRLKSNATTADIPIIAVTSYAMKGDREKALEAGCDGYIAKPIDPIGLPDTVRSYLSREAPAVPEPPPTIPDGPAPARPAILVVEDNPTTLKVMRLTLERHGYEVFAAPNAEAALDAADYKRPDLIIQDLMLPDMDGIALAQRLHERFEDRPVPIICISGLLTRPDESRAVKGGFAAVVVKPIDPLQLLEVVRFHLNLPPEAGGLKGGGRRVLVVDDDPVLLKLSRLWLTNAGFDVVIARDGPQAIEVARRELPDVILSDVMMPGMDGFELCFTTRTDPRLSRIPVILTSAAYGEEDDRALAERVGASALVPRAEGIDEVAAAIIGALEQPLPPAPTTTISTLQHDHAQRALWQLERQIRQNAGLARRVTLQATQLSVLAGVAEALASRRAIETVLGDVLAACLDMAGISRGVLYLRDAGELRLIHQIGYSDREIDRLRSFFGHEDLLRRISGGGDVAAFPSAAFPATIADALLRDADVTSLLVVPVAWGSEMYGAMLLGARKADVTGEDALAFARVLGSQLGQAVGLSRAFRHLAVSEERFRTLVESMEDSVVIVDPAGHVSGAWGRRIKRNDIDPGTWIGRTIEEMLPDDAPAHREAHARALRNEVTTYEWSFQRDADRTLHFQSVVSPVVDDRGAVTSVLRVTRDVTDEKRLQAQLMVSDRVVTIGTLAAGVAHEINNPLTAVIANLDLAVETVRGGDGSEDIRVTPEFAAMLDDAVEAAGRVREIVRDLKLLSRAEEDTRGAVDLHRVLESSLRMAGNEIRHRARVTKVFGDVPPVDANESRLGQVFLNLLINAAQAIPAGHADTHEIRITTLRRHDGLVAAEVRDTGSGIPPDIVERIFDPFFTTKPAGIGTGLGLAICRRIVNNLGGDIEVESTQGVGTTFRVLLPPTQAEPPAPAVIPAARPATRRGRILLVDDDHHVGAIVRRILGRDHDIEVFDSARTGLDRIRAGERYDLIFCDLMMPVVTGMDFHKALVELHPDQAGVVIFLTGGAFTAAARAFLDQVSNPWLEKPFQVDELRAFVNARLG